MHTHSRLNPPAIGQPPAPYAQRRMMAETGMRKPETGNSKQRGRQLRTGEPLRASRSPLYVPASRPAVSGSRCSPVIVIVKPRSSRGSTGSGLPVSGFRCPVSGLAGFPFALPGFVKAIRGRLGDVVYKTYGDKIITTRVPCFDGYVPTAAQRQRREKTRAATAYAQAVYADSSARAVYFAAATQMGRQPFRLAVSDFMMGRPRVTMSTAAAERPTGRTEFAQQDHAKSTGRTAPALGRANCNLRDRVVRLSDSETWWQAHATAGTEVRARGLQSHSTASAAAIQHTLSAISSVCPSGLTLSVGRLCPGETDQTGTNARDYKLFSLDEVLFDGLRLKIAMLTRKHAHHARAVCSCPLR